MRYRAKVSLLVTNWDRSVTVREMSSVLVSVPGWQKVEGKWQTVGSEVKDVEPLPSQERDIDLEVEIAGGSVD